MKKTSRPDAFVIGFIRFAKKLPYFLIENCASKSIYKKPEMESWLNSFMLAYTCFTSLIHYDESNLIQDFVEFCIIYFPKSKCLKLIEALNKDNFTDEYCLKLKKMLENRDIKTKKGINEHMKDSRPWKIIFSLAREVLLEENFPRNKSSKALIKYADSFLS